MKDFSNLNHLSPEIKVLIVNAQVIVNETKEAMQGRKYDFDLTSKRELISNIRNVERCMKSVLKGASKGKISDKKVKQLDHAIVYLRTILNGLVCYYTRGDEEETMI